MKSDDLVLLNMHTHTYMHILGDSVDPLNSYQLWIKNLWVGNRKLLKYYLLNKIIILLCFSLLIYVNLLSLAFNLF